MAKLTNSWIKAAVLGSLWAGNEIIVGSFLHNLRVPMSGTFLAMISIALMSGFLMIWKEKGLVLKAGLIAALMKSISPSAIIMGPMIGILSEALMMEMMISLIGANRLGIMLGGMMGVFSTFLQKLITILVIYGFDFVILLENMFRFATKQLKLESLQPTTAIGMLAIIYLIAGLLASWFGILAGKKSLDYKTQNKLKISWSSDKQNIEQTANSSLWKLILHVLLIIGSLYALNMLSVYLGFSIAILYSLGILLLYKKSFRRLKNPIFWLQMLILVFITSIFWKWFEEGSFFNHEGLLIGLKMMFRALVVILGFSAVSVEIRNPLIQRLLVYNGMGNLYAALNISFSALPTVLDKFVQPRALITKPISSLASIIANAESMFEQFDDKSYQIGELYILSADINTGKTTFLISFIEVLNRENVSVNGILAEKLDFSLPKAGYNLRHIKSKQLELLCDNNESQDGFKKGPFHFKNTAFLSGANTIREALDDESDVIVLDEIGPLELKDKGWAKVIPELLKSSKKKIIVMREPLLDELISHFQIKNYHLMEPDVKRIDSYVKYFKDAT